MLLLKPLLKWLYLKQLLHKLKILFQQANLIQQATKLLLRARRGVHRPR